MNKTVITFKALTYEGKIVCKNITIENEYEVIPSRMWRGIELPETSIEEQVMNELDEGDKTQIMEDNDFYIIIDYWPRKPRKRKDDEITDFVKYCQPVFNKFPYLERPFRAIMAESKDTLFGKGKSNHTKLMEVMKMHELVLKGASGTINMLEKILNPNKQLK